MESQQKSKLHQAKLVTASSSRGKQTYIQIHRVNCWKKVIFSFLVADIPLRKQKHPALKALFVAMEKPLPSKTAARASIVQLSSQKEKNV